MEQLPLARRGHEIGCHWTVSNPRPKVPQSPWQRVAPSLSGHHGPWCSIYKESISQLHILKPSDPYLCSSQLKTRVLIQKVIIYTFNNIKLFFTQCSQQDPFQTEPQAFGKRERKERGGGGRETDRKRGWEGGREEREEGKKYYWPTVFENYINSIK